MAKTITLEPEKKVFCDSLTITVLQDKVRFSAEIDHDGNTFVMSKRDLKEFLWKY